MPSSLPAPAGAEPISVSALNRAVAASLGRGFPLVRVRGEIGNVTRAASGHWYFTLKDDAAQVRCVMFRGRNALVDFAPLEGDEVELRASVGLYEARGEFQLTVDSMQRAGQGRLFEEFLRLKRRLAAEGLFDESLKRSLPRLPRRIGIMTSPQAAALGDVLTALRRRAPYARLIVYPVPVQGAGAAEQIAAMLARASARAEADVLLLVRGGGSLEDLWAFNEEPVARAIRACSLPVVVGVGHESDISIADFAADLRAATPTAAAELVAPEQAMLQASVAALAQRLRRLAQQRLQQAQQRLDYATRMLSRPSAPIAGLGARVEHLRLRLRASLAASLSRSESVAVACRLRLERHRPDLGAAMVAARALNDRLRAALRAAQESRRARLERARQALDHLDPAAVLGRGYALALDAEGHVVTDAVRLRAGDRLDLRLARGQAAVSVEEVRQDPASRESPGAGSRSI